MVNAHCVHPWQLWYCLLSLVIGYLSKPNLFFFDFQTFVKSLIYQTFKSKVNNNVDMKTVPVTERQKMLTWTSYWWFKSVIFWFLILTRFGNCVLGEYDKDRHVSYLLPFFRSSTINPFVLNAPFLYPLRLIYFSPIFPFYIPLKTLEIQRFWV